MAIQAVSLPTQITGAKGQYRTSLCQYVSDIPLTGQLLNFNAALFLQNFSSNPDNNAWSLVYPAAPGVYDMDFVASDLYRNFKVEVEVFDSKTFTITLKYFFVADLNDWTGDTAPNNGIIFADGYGSYSTVYGGVKKLIFRAEIGGSSDRCEISAQSVGFCTQDIITFELRNSSDSIVAGYIPGDNLTVNINASTTSLSNNFYAGFYREDQSTNAVNFVTDLGLNYGLVNSGVSSVDTDVPITCFVGGQGFVSDGITSTAQVEIDGTCFQENGSYRFYIIYQQNGIWNSCRTDAIIQVGTGREPIIPDVSCLVTDNFGNSVSDCCVKGLTYLNIVDANVIIDRVSYDAALVTAGLPGSLEDYLQSVTVFQTNELPDDIESVLQTGVPNVTTKFTPSGVDTTAKTFSVPNSFAGTKYLVFCHEFKYGDNDIDVIYVVVQLSYVANEETLDPTFTINGNVITDLLCAEEDGTLEVTDPEIDEDCEVFISVGGTLFEQSDGTIVTDIQNGQFDVDVSQLSLDTEYCIKLLCFNVGAPSNPCTECSDITLHQTVDINSCNPMSGLCSVTYNWWFTGIDAGVTQISYSGTISTGGSAGSYTGPLTSQVFVFNVDDVGSAFLNTSFLVILDNGCEYTATTQVDFNTESPFPAGLDTNLSPSVCPPASVPPVCDNQAWINFDCDPVTQTINLSTAESFTSTPDTDDFLCSTDGINFVPCLPSYVGEPKVFAQRNVTFTDECDPVNIEQVIDCIPVISCINSINVLCDLQPTLLTLTLDDTLNSVIAVDNLLVSIDGGVSFGPYVGPIILVGGESIIITRTVSFTDGCPTISITPIQKVNGAAGNCDYSGFDTDCTFDSTTKLFTASFTGDETGLSTNVKEYSIDGGDTFLLYTVPVTGFIFMVRWTLEYPDCTTEIITKACCDPNNPTVDEDGKLLIKICGPVEIEGSIDVVITDIQDCFELCPPACGTPFNPGAGGDFGGC